MRVRKNNYTSQSPEAKAQTSRNLLVGRTINRNPVIPSKSLQSKKLFSEFLREYYHANPKKLKKLMIVCIEYAEAGHARFAEMILDRLEGPVKHEVELSGSITHALSDADRERARSIVDDIQAMDAKTITIQETQCQIPETSSSSETQDLKPLTTA